ncbi:MAG: NAD-dependent epimerase/dehydratase family protein [Parcubacteria group bacterium]
MNSDELRNVLILGGAGFIGSYLCQELIKRNNVVCVDNFSTGSLENIAPLLQNPRFKFIKHDLTEPLALETYAELIPLKVPYVGVHEIYNLACPASPQYYSTYPIQTLLASSHATKNALDIAVKYKAKFIHFSSAAVYGEPLDARQLPESYWGYTDFLGPRSVYSEGKRFSESMVTQYRMTFGIDAKIIRLFNVYGPRMRLTDGRMIPEFIRQALKGEDIHVMGSDSDTVTLCYVSDCIEALTRVARSKDTSPMNIGSPEEITISDVARKIVELMGVSSKIIFESRSPFVARQGTPDISLAKERLGWFPVVSLVEGLKQTIEYMRGSEAVDINEVKV